MAAKGATLQGATFHVTSNNINFDIPLDSEHEHRKVEVRLSGFKLPTEVDTTFYSASKINSISIRTDTDPNSCTGRYRLDKREKDVHLHLVLSNPTNSARAAFQAAITVCLHLTPLMNLKDIRQLNIVVQQSSQDPRLSVEINKTRFLLGTQNKCPLTTLAIWTLEKPADRASDRQTIYVREAAPPKPPFAGWQQHVEEEPTDFTVDPETGELTYEAPDDPQADPSKGGYLAPVPLDKDSPYLEPPAVSPNTGLYLVPEYQDQDGYQQTDEKPDDELDNSNEHYGQPLTSRPQAKVIPPYSQPLRKVSTSDGSGKKMDKK